MNEYTNTIYLNCRKRYKEIVHHRSYVHNLSSCEIKALKKIRPEFRERATLLLRIYLKLVKTTNECMTMLPASVEHCTGVSSNPVQA